MYLFYCLGLALGMIETNIPSSREGASRPLDCTSSECEGKVDLKCGQALGKAVSLNEGHLEGGGGASIERQLGSFAARPSMTRSIPPNDFIKELGTRNSSTANAYKLAHTSIPRPREIGEAPTARVVVWIMQNDVCWQDEMKPTDSISAMRMRVPIDGFQSFCARQSSTQARLGQYNLGSESAMRLGPESAVMMSIAFAAWCRMSGTKISGADSMAGNRQCTGSAQKGSQLAPKMAACVQSRERSVALRHEDIRR